WLVTEMVDCLLGLVELAGTDQGMDLQLLEHAGCEVVHHPLCLVHWSLRPAKAGKGGKRCRVHRRNLSKRPAGVTPAPQSLATSRSQSCVLAGNRPDEA